MSGRTCAIQADRERDFRADWRANVPAAEMALKYDVTVQTVTHTARRLGLVPRRSRNVPATTLEERADLPKPTMWRCPCGGLSVTGPLCERCAARVA